MPGQDTFSHTMNPSETVSARIAGHVAGLQYDRLPASIVDHAKLIMLDTLAVAWAGSDAPGCREVHGLFAADGGAPQATCWAFGGRLPAAEAAFINGGTAAALDYDSFGRDAPVHTNIVILPVALAMAEWLHASPPRSHRRGRGAWPRGRRHRIGGSRPRGLLERRVDHVPGSAEAPLGQAAIDAKFDECFARGVRPLDPLRTRMLRERVAGMEAIDDLSTFFDGICAD